MFFFSNLTSWGDTIVVYGSESLGNQHYVYAIKDLDINGIHYDVTFDGGSFNENFVDAPSEGDFVAPTFHDFASAQNATQAIIDRLMLSPDGSWVAGFTDNSGSDSAYPASLFIVPYDAPVTSTTYQAAIYAGQASGGPPYGYWMFDHPIYYSSEWGRTYDDNQWHWAKFTAVPEPTSLFALLGWGGLGLIGMRFRRKLV